tara:strand:+ start:5794 stop:6180 length:387 start_codon:yes stop_codon:yes gene_type:complete
MTTTTKGQHEQKEAIENLRALFKGARKRETLTVYCILRHRSRSGMSRVIDMFVIRNGQPYRLSWNASKAIGWAYDREHNGVKVRGCGMDMGHHLVYTLSRVLFQGSNKKDYNGNVRNDKGYVLNAEWV